MSMFMWIFVIVPLMAAVVLLTFNFQSAKKDDGVKEAFEDAAPPPPPAESSPPVPEKENEKLYENRLFVIKTFDSLSRKPSADQLARLSQIDDRVEIMKQIIEEVNNSPEAAAADEAVKVEVEAAEEEGYRGYALVGEEQQEDEKKVSEEEKPVSGGKKAQARRYIREMYATLGKLDNEIS
jgi:hypothetical protein